MPLKAEERASANDDPPGLLPLYQLADVPLGSKNCLDGILAVQLIPGVIVAAGVQLVVGLVHVQRSMVVLQHRGVLETGTTPHGGLVIVVSREAGTPRCDLNTALAPWELLGREAATQGFRSQLLGRPAQLHVSPIPLVGSRQELREACAAPLWGHEIDLVQPKSLCWSILRPEGMDPVHVPAPTLSKVDAFR